MQEVFVIAATRTAIGKMGKTLKQTRPDELAGVVLTDVLKRAGIPAELVDEVILGQTRQSTEAANIARYAALLAGYPETIPAYTVMQQCASGMLAVQNAMDQIALERADVVVAGGVESLSMAPFYLRDARYGLGVGNNVLVDSVTEGQINSQPVQMYGSFGMGLTAENVAERYHITREEQDAFAFQSQSRYRSAFEAGKFKEEIAPMEIPQRKADPIVFAQDECPRLSTIEQLSKLKPVFKAGGTVTAGNACGRSDGASVLLLMGERRMRALGLRPMARLVSYAATGVDPRYMGIGPVTATQKALEHAGLSLNDIGLVELNEAFAAQSLAVIRELGLDEGIVNVNGGAIALGHPLGATGARILTTLLHEMGRRPEARFGLATLCVGGGMGSATILERV